LRPALLNGRGLVARESEVLHAGSSEVLGAAHPSPVISSSSSVRMVVQNSAMPTFPRVANPPNTKPVRPAVGRARVSAKTEGPGAETDPIGQARRRSQSVAAQHAKPSTMGKFWASSQGGVGA
jgi:hypothetical protein